MNPLIDVEAKESTVSLEDNTFFAEQFENKSSREPADMKEEDQEKQIDEHKDIQEEASISEADSPHVDSELEKPEEQSEPEKQDEAGKPVDAASNENKDLCLQELIDKMQSSLAQEGAPNFKLFWELRKACLEMFKENISPIARTLSWARYRELSKEAKKLKDILDEESAFAVEQIEIAIKALENDIAEMSQHLEKIERLDLDLLPKSFEKKKEYYSSIQKKLNLLNAHAARINTLRKELIKTEMRIKHKNNFFERLSKAGDNIFPGRKDLIKEVSDNFEKDIEAFVERYFGSQKEFVPTYVLRDDIKHLQNIAKILTLNSQAFSSTRKNLSECWDALKLMDKERKKEIQVKRESVKKTLDELVAKIEEIDLAFNEGQTSPTECLDKAEELFKELRAIDLGKEDGRVLKDKLFAVKKKAQDKIKEKHDERERLEVEKRHLKREALREWHRKITEAISASAETSALDLKERAASLREEAREFLANPGKESQDIEKKLKSLDDFVSEKEEEELIESSSHAGVDSLKTLREILQQKKKRRLEIKEEIEKLRKSSSNSGFDIEKALLQNEQIGVEKERLEKADETISEIEDKIAAVKAELKKNS